jgi:hypothetical protein
VIKVSEEITKVDCHLIARGTQEADTQASDDLDIPDPDPSVGEKIVEEEIEDDVKPECS